MYNKYQRDLKLKRLMKNENEHQSDEDGDQEFSPEALKKLAKT